MKEHKEFRTRQAVVDCCHWKVGPLPTGIEESSEGRPIIAFPNVCELL